MRLVELPTCFAVRPALPLQERIEAVTDDTASAMVGAHRVAASALHVVPIARGPATEIKLPHGVDRIEPMSPGAMVIGADGNDLHFSGIRLSKRFTRKDASQGELRSHVFSTSPTAQTAACWDYRFAARAGPGSNTSPKDLRRSCFSATNHRASAPPAFCQPGMRQ